MNENKWYKMTFGINSDSQLTLYISQNSIISSITLIDWELNLQIFVNSSYAKLINVCFLPYGK